MRRGVLILFFACLCLTSSGKGSMQRFTFGTEWSYCASFLSGYRYYFIAPEGYREELHKDMAGYNTDGEVFIHGGYNFNIHWNLSLYLGYTGIGNYHHGIPVSLRATRYFGDNPINDRWFAYCDIGSGISIKDKPAELITAKAGGGYRMSLSRVTKLDFLASLRFIYTHPDIIYYDAVIPSHDIGRNDGYIMSVSVGIGLTF